MVCVKLKDDERGRGRREEGDIEEKSTYFNVTFPFCRGEALSGFHPIWKGYLGGGRRYPFRGLEK